MSNMFQGFTAVSKKGFPQQFQDIMAAGVVSPPDGGFHQMSDMREDALYRAKLYEPSDFSDYDEHHYANNSQMRIDNNLDHSEILSQRLSFPSYGRDSGEFHGDKGRPYSYHPKHKPPNSLLLGDPFEHRYGYTSDKAGSITRLGLPLCDGISVNRTSLRTPLLEDDRESCV